MQENDYDVIEFSQAELAVPGEYQIVKDGVPVGAITANVLPDAAFGKVKFRWGPSGKYYTMVEGYPWTRKPAQKNGVWIQLDAGIAAGVGEHLEIIAGFDYAPDA